MKSLIVYFSAEAGTTRKVAEDFAAMINADLYEINPEKAYSSADLRWANPLSRCNREKIGKKEVPVTGKVEAWESYDTVFLGFPIWYGCAPNVVNTFCKGYDWNGKKIYIFATSGGSGIGRTAQKLEPYVEGGTIVDARRVRSVGELSDWKTEQ